MWLAHRMYGGEISSESGFGLRMIRISGMMSGQSGSVRFSFDPLSFIVSLLLLGLAVYFLIFLSGKFIKK